MTVFSRSNKDSEVVVVDGLFFSIKSSIFKSVSFDEKIFDRFHFYDLDICMQIRRSHRLIVTSDILVKHLSGGRFDEYWKKYGKRFIAKYQKELPAYCTDIIPKSILRQNFTSVDLFRVVTPKEYERIRSLGER